MDKISEILESEIARRGAIPFSRFMELALYCPVYGFYEAEEDTIGRRGNFYTSVSVGPLFGELLAWQFAAWLHGLSIRAETASQPLRLVEAGAHGGQLAHDILNWILRSRPALARDLEYVIVEHSSRRQEWQRKHLSKFARQVRWVESLDRLRQLNPDGICGVLFANELLDSFPVHRMGWDRQKRTWFEWGVTFIQGRFVWTRHDATSPQAVTPEHQWLDPNSVTERFELTPELLDVLPDGFIVEVCPSADIWWQEAAGLLRSGKLLTLDYGLTTDEWIVPERTAGTLRGYRQHKLTEDVLADPGKQDLTAHVNFTSVRAAGERAGLITEALETQGRFLTRVAATASLGGAVGQSGSDPEPPGPGSAFGHSGSDPEPPSSTHLTLNPPPESGLSDWTPARTRQFQTLIHPQHLGFVFRVLLQARGCM